MSRLTKDKNKKEWLGVQVDLAGAYFFQQGPTRKEGLLRAKKLIENVLKNCSENEFPDIYKSAIGGLKTVNQFLANDPMHN
jgi:hypothetical protein